MNILGHRKCAIKRPYLLSTTLSESPASCVVIGQLFKLPCNPPISVRVTCASFLNHIDGKVLS